MIAVRKMSLCAYSIPKK